MDRTARIMDAYAQRSQLPEVHLPRVFKTARLPESRVGCDDCCASQRVFVSTKAFSMRGSFCPVIAIATISIAVFLPNAGRIPILGIASLRQWTAVELARAQSSQIAGGHANTPQATVWRFDQIESLGGQPLPGAIRTTRHSAVYAMHSYHQGKKPHDAIRQYIRHFSRHTRGSAALPRHPCSSRRE